MKHNVEFIFRILLEGGYGGHETQSNLALCSKYLSKSRRTPPPSEAEPCTYCMSPCLLLLVQTNIPCCHRCFEEMRDSLVLDMSCSAYLIKKDIIIGE